ncbi:MAG: UTP--glucose-1-phosphate uridylyltransferase [Planctomycetota bacterium]|nr:MAG: UTP--glucose-1-phosphate uridylyltransferase [Planctomycetota bacterium]
MDEPVCAVIPAAGRGTRHGPLTRAVPKELLPVAGRPLVDWALEACVQAGLERVVLVTSPAKPLLLQYLRERWQLAPLMRGPGAALRSRTHPLELELAVQPRPRGLVDALWCARAALGEPPRCALVLPDWVHFGAPSPLAQLLAEVRRGGRLQQQGAGPAAIFACFELGAEHAPRYGNCGLLGGEREPASGWLRIERLGAKASGPLRLAPGTSAWRSAGAVLLGPAFFAAAARLYQSAPPAAELDDGPVFQELLRRGEQLWGVPVRGLPIDAGNPRGYAAAHAAALEQDAIP